MQKTESGLSGLKAIRAEFPEELDLPENTIDRVLISRLFHFFTGERIRESLRKVYAWLKPGGKVFIVADSVYRTIFKELIPLYEKNVAQGVKWPGWFENVRKLIPQGRLNPETQPLAMNLTDSGLALPFALNALFYGFLYPFVHFLRGHIPVYGFKNLHRLLIGL